MSGGRATTTATGNIAGGSVTVSGAGSRLTLGANLVAADGFTATTVSGGGTLDAQGFSPTVNNLNVSGVNGVTTPLLNVGTISAGRSTQAGGSQVTLGAGDSSVGSLALSQTSTLTSSLVSGAAGRLTVSGTATGALSIEAGSRLALTLDGDVPGYALRWADPSGGNHVAELNAFISSGAITITPTDNAQYQVFSDGSFTYLFQPVPEPAHLLLAAAGGVAVVRGVRRRGRVVT